MIHFRNTKFKNMDKFPEFMIEVLVVTPQLNAKHTNKNNTYRLFEIHTEL